jgi:hypothetical protein
MKKLLVIGALEAAFLTGTQARPQEQPKQERKTQKETPAKEKKKAPAKEEKKGPNNKSLDDPTFHKGGKQKK